MRPTRHFTLIFPGLLAGLVLLLLTVMVPSMSRAADDAAAIMQKVYDARQIDDEIATLTFHFIDPDDSEKKVVYTMVWKNAHGEDGYDNKAIFFTESPLDKKGIAYLGWLYPHGSDKLNDEWLYLPELRTIRRIVQSKNHDEHNEDEFANSLLSHEQLQRRSPKMDNHTLLDEQMLDGRPHYLISSTPKPGGHMHMHMDGHGHPTARRINWVDKDSLLLDRVQFLDEHDTVQLDMKIDWQQIQDYWLWKRIEAIDPNSKEKTLLEISDIKINSHLDDSIFQKRALTKGSRRFK